VLTLYCWFYFEFFWIWKSWGGFLRQSIRGPGKLCENWNGKEWSWANRVDGSIFHTVLEEVEMHVSKKRWHTRQWGLGNDGNSKMDRSSRRRKWRHLVPRKCLLVAGGAHSNYNCQGFLSENQEGRNWQAHGCRGTTRCAEACRCAHGCGICLEFGDRCLCCVSPSTSKLATVLLVCMFVRRFSC